jgi:hypothetical protein
MNERSIIPGYFYTNGLHFWRVVNSVENGRVKYTRVGGVLLKNDNIHFMDDGECSIKQFVNWSECGITKSSFAMMKKTQGHTSKNELIQVDLWEKLHNNEQAVVIR